jgi:hypothetical protein
MPNQTVRLHRVIRAPSERIYRAFLDADALAKWLPPNGFTCKVHQLDAREGGSYHASFTNFTTGDSHSFGGEYLELVPHGDVDLDRSPSSTRPIAPPSAASGETWPIDRPDVPPEKRPSVISAQLCRGPSISDSWSDTAFPACRGRPRAFIADHDDVAGLDLAAEDAFDRASWLSKTAPGRRISGCCSSTPAVFTMQPSSARLPYSTARPPSLEKACSRRG